MQKVSAFAAAADAGTTENTSQKWDWNSFWSTVFNWLTTHGLQLLIGLVVLFVCFIVINIVARVVRNSMIKHNRDKTVTSVVYQLIKKGLKIVLVILFLGYVGIDTAGIGAIIGAVGVAIGLAAQGALSNFAGGMIILVMRPFKVGDYVETDGEKGTVEDIHMFYTYIVTDNNQVVMIPNGEITSGAIVNYSMKETRRLDLKFSIAYNEDFEYAEDVLFEICEKHEKVLKDPAPFVRIDSHGDSSIVLLLRVWTKTADYWEVNFDLLEEVKRRFDEEGIEIPYPQLDVHTPEPQPLRTRPKTDTRKRRLKARQPKAAELPAVEMPEKAAEREERKERRARAKERREKKLRGEPTEEEKLAAEIKEIDERRATELSDGEK